jgi:hypothetical protein
VQAAYIGTSPDDHSDYFANIADSTISGCLVVATYLVDTSTYKEEDGDGDGDVRQRPMTHKDLGSGLLVRPALPQAPGPGSI